MHVVVSLSSAKKTSWLSMVIVLITVIRAIVSGKLKNDTYSGTTAVTTIITIGCPLIT